jgi:nicotinamidase-related amidase
MKFAFVIVDIQDIFFESSGRLLPSIQRALEIYEFDHITSVYFLPPAEAQQFDRKKRSQRLAYIKREAYPQIAEASHLKIIKPWYSALDRTCLKKHLKPKNPENIIACGIFGDCCMRASLIDFSRQFPTSNIIFANDICEGDVYETTSEFSKTFDMRKLSRVHSLPLDEIPKKFGLPLRKSPISSSTCGEVSTSTHSSGNLRTIEISA